MISGLATKEDIAILEQKIETVRQELRGEIKVLKILIYVIILTVILMNGERWSTWCSY